MTNGPNSHHPRAGSDFVSLKLPYPAPPQGQAAPTGCTRGLEGQTDSESPQATGASDWPSTLHTRLASTERLLPPVKLLLSACEYLYSPFQQNK